MMDLTSVRKAYRIYAPVYDYVFGRIVNEGRRLAISRFPQNPGDRILETGVGTGLSLPFYQQHVEVTGVDVSPEMLQKARKRFQTSKHPHVKELLEMDAQDLSFPDNSFHGAVAMYVASVIPDPRAMMLEMFRVTEPGSPVLVVNHFASQKPLLRTMENRLAPFSRKLGFQPDFSLERFVEVIGFGPNRVTTVNVGGYWKLLEFTTPAAPISHRGNGQHGTRQNGNADDRKASGVNHVSGPESSSGPEQDFNRAR
jgi:phosphatidylethanolamine/phosphatidyl-N-methylethanolamine N-methyltransferase